ncbi:MAG: TetR/AcrR family transcriptional regulator [Actinomycetales bacterium]|nr:TetR/AcrR family transcriptional regulator [Actinomycetales bacterium]
MTVPAERVPRRRSNTRARLIEAAREVFAARGLHGATVDDLVAAAGFTRGAFYSNFSTMEEVFFALFEQQSAEMIALARDAVADIPDEDFGFHSVGLVLDRLRPLGRQWYLIHSEFVLHALRSPRMAAVFLDHRRRWGAELAELVTGALRRLHRRATVPPEQLVEVLFSLYIDSLAQEHLGAWPDGPGRMIEDVIPAVLTGLSEPDPRSPL